MVCEVDPELTEKLRKFRFRKETDNAAIISEWHLPSWKDGRALVGAHKEGWACVPCGSGECLIPVCHTSPVKVDKDRQMVVLEEEFQVRGWGGWDWEVRAGTGRPKWLELI